MPESNEVTPIYYASNLMENHQKKMQEEFNKEASNRVVEKEDLLQLIHGELESIKNILNDFASGYGDATEKEQNERTQTFTERLKESFDKFKENVSAFFKRMDEKLAIKEPVNPTTETENILKTYKEDKVQAENMGKIATELEKPVAKKEVVKQNQTLQKEAMDAFSKGTLTQETLENMLKQHFEKTEKMVLNHLEKIGELTTKNELPNQGKVENQRKNFREKLNETMSQWKENANTAIKSTVEPVQKKVTEVKDKIRQVTSENMMALGEELHGVGLAMQQKPKEYPSQNVNGASSMNHKSKNTTEQQAQNTVDKQANFDEYPSFILGATSNLPTSIIEFDKQNTPKISLDARIEATNKWMETKSGKNYINDQKMVEKMSELVLLSKQNVEDMSRFVAGESLISTEKNLFKEAGGNLEKQSPISQKQQEVAESVDIMKYLQAKGEKFEHLIGGKYKHVDYDNLKYNAITKVLTYDADSVKQVANNAVEAGQVMYGFDKSQAIKDVIDNKQNVATLEKESDIRMENKKEVSMSKTKNNLDEKESEIQQAKQDYIQYLAGGKIPEGLKEFDRKNGIEEALQIRLEAIDEELMFGSKIDKNDSVINNKKEQIQTVFRASENEKDAYLWEEYKTRTPQSSQQNVSPNNDLDNLLQSMPGIGMEKADIIPEYQAFLKSNYNGEPGINSDILKQYDQEFGLDAGMKVRLDAVNHLLEDNSISYTEADYMENVKYNIEESISQGTEGMHKYKENELEGNIEKSMQDKQEQSPLVKGIR
ncbi:hypothetical protein [Listeria seeligeri]|uniref:hypothetical protein n=1 Tax=Listeria seeligeri TaxID=1640 RepID=UPI0022EBFEF7|nr:hypothetical protein [Listeria seeligeri]